MKKLNDMKICLDGMNLALKEGTGVATYARNLSRDLKEMGAYVGVVYGTTRPPSRNPLLRQIAFFDEENVGKPGKAKRYLTYMEELIKSPFGGLKYPVPIDGTVIYDAFKSRMPHCDQIIISPNLFRRGNKYFSTFKKFYKLKGLQYDIMHWTYPVPIYKKGARNIYTIHDLVPLRLPYTTLDKKNKYFRLIKNVLKHAEKIATVSETTKKDIINIFGVKEEKIINTYQSVRVPERYLNVPEIEIAEEIKSAYDLDFGQYVLFFGAIEPKKNISRLIQAYMSSGIEMPLVIVGKKAWKSEEELKYLIDDFVRYEVVVDGKIYKRDRIIFINYVPYYMLVSLIRGAQFVAFPSLYEGFGLPVVEAMACGTPVLTSTAGSLPEIAADAALLVDPYDVRAIKEGMQRLHQSAELRDTLRNKGKKRAEYFTFDNLKDRLCRLYGCTK